MPALKDLQEQRLAKATAIKEMASRSKEWTAEDTANWTKLNGEYDALAASITEQMEAERSAAAIQSRLASIESDDKRMLGDKGVGLDHGERKKHNPEVIERTRQQAEVVAIQAWLRSDVGMDLTADHLAACRQLGVNPNAKRMILNRSYDYGEPAWSCSNGRQSQREFRVGLDVATAGAGQETIPQGFVAELERRTLAFANVRQVCRVIQTASGNALPWPNVDDTGNSGALLAEATTIGTSVDPTFAATTFNAYKYSSKPVFVSEELLEDSAFNLMNEIPSLLGERLGRIEASETTTGTGSSRTKGVVTCAGTGVTSASATVITADEILGLIHSLDPSYRGLSSVGFMFHDTALLYIRKLKDANGAYLWMPGLQAGVADTLLGYRVSINQQMEPLVSNLPVTAKKHVLFGAFEKYVIRDAAQVRLYRLEERYRDTDQTAFIAFKRFDGDTIQANALKVLLQA